MTFLEEKMPDIKRLCDTHHVARLYAFGSVIRPDFSNTSDVDLMVEMMNLSPDIEGELLTEIWNILEKIFTRPVDLLTESSIKNPYLCSEIQRTRKLVYEHSH